jgi:hypothetical protein
MVQDQLVDYISSQIKLGVSREAISAALVSAGWVAMDVADTLKKIDTKTVQTVPVTAAAQTMQTHAQPATASVSPVGAMHPATASPMGTSPLGTMAAGAKPATPMTSPIGGMTTTATAVKPMGIATGTSPASPAGGPQMIKVSDLVSTTPSGARPVSSPMIDMKKSPAAAVDMSKFAGKISGNNFEAAGAPVKKGSSGMKVVAVILILIFAGLAGFFYWQNMDLSSKVSSLTNDSQTATTQATTLQAQLDSAGNDFSSQVKSLKAANDDLTLNLSFYVAQKDATTTAITVGGTLTSSGGRYAIVTPRAAKIYVVASDLKVLSTIKASAGQTVVLTGTFVPGTDQMTATSIQGGITPTSTTPIPAGGIQ